MSAMVLAEEASPLALVGLAHLFELEQDQQMVEMVEASRELL